MDLLISWNIFVNFLITVAKTFKERKTKKKQLKDKKTFGSAHSLKPQMSWWDHEAAGRIESTVRKLGFMDAGAQLTFFFLFSLGLKPHGTVPIFRVSPATSTNPI